eukprot:5723950-Alexandrium_andersonii.AAC.1
MFSAMRAQLMHVAPALRRSRDQRSRERDNSKGLRALRTGGLQIGAREFAIWRLRTPRASLSSA